MSTELAINHSDIIQMIELADLSDSTKAKYRSAITRYLATGANLGDSHALAEYAKTLSQSGRAFLKAVIKLWAGSMALEVKAGATPNNVDAVTATLYRLDAVTDSIKVKASKGEKAHIWLSRAEVKRLLAACDTSTITGQRDKLVLGLLTGAGLRREELVALTWNNVKVQPIRGKVRTVLNITGKGDKSRIIPINDNLAKALDRWAGIVGKEGLVIRSLGMSRKPGDSISTVAIFHIATKAGAAIGRPELAPHDLRRTYAQIGYEAGIPITQLSKLLGHSSIATTQRYLNLELNLETTASDFVPFE
jgi:integrase